MPASVGARDRMADNIDKNAFPHGDYLQPVVEGSIKMALMLVENKRGGKKEAQLDMGGRRQLQFVILNRESKKATLGSDILVKT